MGGSLVPTDLTFSKPGAPLEELAATFKTQGVLEPLLVRELEKRNYQVVIGARRLRVAKIAELEAVPVRVVRLTDAEAIEAQSLHVPI
jgi:ParB family chromosome partitioning protein